MIVEEMLREMNPGPITAFSMDLLQTWAQTAELGC